MGVALSASGNSLVRVKFTGKDWDTIMAELNNYILAAFGQDLYNAFTADDAGQMFLETVAYGLMAAYWFLDRQAGEDTLDTAELPSSVARLARLVGYRVSGAVPATGNVQVTLIKQQTFPVQIAQGTQLTSVNGTTYETSAALTFNAGQVGPLTVGVVEGKTIVEVFTATGLAGQFCYLRNVPTNATIAQGSATATVDGVVWPANKFLQFGQTNQVEFAYAESPPYGHFGDSIAGNIPPVGAEIRITYRATLGTAGAAPANTIVAFSQPVTANNVAIPVVVTNTASTAPGSDVESIAHAKALAGQVFSAGDRAVNQVDYEALINAFVDPNYGAVAVGQAVVARTYNEDAETRTILNLVEAQAGALPVDLKTRLRSYWSSVLASNDKANLVSVQILQRDANGVLIAPNSGLAGALKTYLSTRAEATVALSVVDGSINLFTVYTSVEVNIDPTYSSSSVLASVQTAVDAYLTSKTYGDAARLGDVYAAVEALAGVKYANVQFTQVLNYLGVAVNKLDTFGNVAVQSYEVLTLGVTTVTQQ